MKKYIFSLLICSLVALVGCQKSEDITLNNQGNGEKITVTANIETGVSTRVSLSPATDVNSNPIVKVDWKESGETFKVYGDTDATAQPFTQTDENKNKFSGDLPTTSTNYWAYYNCSPSGVGGTDITYDLSNQDGTLNESYVIMTATSEKTDAPVFDFSHKTFILKPTFKVGDDIINNTVARIVMNGVKNVNTSNPTSEKITVNATGTNDLYIFIPGSESYTNEYSFTFEVIAGGLEYTASLTLPESTTLSTGNIYTATLSLTPKSGTPYVKFIAEEEQKFYIHKNNYDDIVIGNLEYSTNGNDWTSFTADIFDSNKAIEFGGTKGDLYLRGKLSNGTCQQNATGNNLQIKFTTDAAVACSGDIRTLINYENYSTLNDFSNVCFHYLFLQCNQLTSAPALPATILGKQSYSYMFSQCTNLTKAPELPAEQLGEKCYYGMFVACKSLTTAPELPATSLAINCYDSMFNQCTNLTEAPKLPATTLAESCYKYMFWNTGITTAPELPATSLAKDCYNNMFRQCTNLTTAPALNATDLVEGCYNAMFFQCSNLENAPELKAKTLVKNCYNNMFYQCSKISNITMLATDISAEKCLYWWLYGVASSGTFIKDASMTTLSTGISGIPSNWTVQNYQ